MPTGRAMAAGPNVGGRPLNSGGSGGNTGGTGVGGSRSSGGTGGGLYPRATKASRAGEPTVTVVTDFPDEVSLYQEALKRAGYLLESGGQLI